MQLWLLLSILTVVSVYALMWVKTRRARRMLRGLPQYSELPIIGSLYLLAGSDGAALYRLISDMSDKFEVFDKPIVFWAGPVPVILLTDLEDVKLVSNTFIEKPYYYNFGKIWLGDGLVTAPGDIWKRNIKKLSGLFTSSVVDSFLPIFNAQAHKLVQRLCARAAGPPLDVMQDLAYTTLESICQTSLGVESISKDVGGDSYYHAFNRTLELFVARGLNLFLHPDCIYRLTPSYKELKKCVSVLHGVSNTVLRQRKLHKEQLKGNGRNDTNGEFKSVIDILLELGLEAPAQVRAEVDTVILGGQETVATTLTYAIIMLATHTHVQERLHAEMKAIYGDSNRGVEKVDLARMEYCEAVITETLRLYPPFPGVLRHADRDLALKSCTIPAGSTVLLSAWCFGRSRRVWGADALHFKPERWLQGQPPGPAAAFLAFSYGRRACIGKRYAMAIMKTILAQCVRELEFKTQGDPLQFKIDLVLRPVSGHLVQICRRNK